MTKRKTKTYQMKYIPKEDVHDMKLIKEKHHKILTKENEQILSKIVSAQGFKTI